MPAVDALVMRTAVHEQLQNPKFLQLLDSYARLEGEQFGRRDSLAQRQFGGAVFKNVLPAAETYYVGPDMHELASRASDDFPKDETIMKEDLPSEVGFMYLPARFRLFELRGRLVVVHAVLWANDRAWLLTDRNDPDDEMSAYLRDEAAKSGREWNGEFGRYDVSGLLSFNFGKPVPQTLSFAKNVLPPSAKVEFVHMPDGRTAMHTDHVIDNTQKPESRPDPALLFLLAVWRLMQQTLASVHREDDVPRHARRRADRFHAPTGVTVIQLRRREGEYEGTGQSINYRYLRRGHWRRVWCGPKDKQYQRAVYIHETICGPEGAPLIIRDRINALVR